MTRPAPTLPKCPAHPHAVVCRGECLQCLADTMKPAWRNVLVGDGVRRPYRRGRSGGMVLKDWVRR